MELTCEMHGETLVIRLETESLDASRSQTFKQQVMDAIEQYQTHKVVFDLSLLTFIDSSGLGAFLSILRHLHSKGGDLKLCSMSSPVKTMFQIVRMHKLFEIFDNVDGCLKAFAK